MCAQLFANNTSVLLSMMIHEDKGMDEYKGGRRRRMNEMGDMGDGGGVVLIQRKRGVGMDYK